MANITFIKDYKNNHILRKSFNELSEKTFGINFEDWYQEGYWTEKYVPYSLREGGEIVANVSVNKVNLLINGKKISALQIGTVMTEIAYRGRGYSRILMEKVMEEYKDCQLIYLFANQSVLDYYPKFGFCEFDETLFSIEFQGVHNENTNIRCLDIDKDKEFIYNFAAGRKNLSAYFDTSDTPELLMFYALKVFTEDFYFLEKDNVLAICQQKDEVLHLFDLISETINPDIENIVKQLAAENTSKVVFHFTPPVLKRPIIKERYEGGNILFVKNNANIPLPQFLRHPITSQA
ncbi:GNAT family N-acetyltransferase [Neobacillus terrae]|uniref:GNAT family N-acetyltransferase n=1 Tax=Neobacillus terrae TaxID=3034837 RepID=UPI0014080801|nr:GNAT family N-acetyltransferase [Neobacillus terrae]NHM32133.1 GNAT family N-acetyltransferase [Neobacillus terrae]